MAYQLLLNFAPLLLQKFDEPFERCTFPRLDGVGLTLEVRDLYIQIAGFP
jgi:hypothetical protein